LAFGALFSLGTSYFYLNPIRLPRLQNILISSTLAGFSVALLPVVVLRAFLHLFFFRYKAFLFEERPSLLTRLWQVCYLALKKLAPPRLRSCDAFLPKQPVPRLEESVNGYLESMEPLMGEVGIRGLWGLKEN
jgi:hypothetical protein